jgi:signal transduction histidine kinase
MHDVSRQQVLEDQLERVLKLKEKQITDAMQEAKETTRSELGKELHDNVNQLLGVSRLYLSMAKKGGSDGAMYLSRSSEYTMTAIEAIRKLSKDLTSDSIGVLGLGDAIGKIARDTMETSGLKITYTVTPLVEAANEKFKINIFRIIQEQLNNILKHAAATKVSIIISQTKTEISLRINDNGKGFNTFSKHHGIGVDNIKSRATTHHGVAQFVSRPGHGCKLTVAFAR